MVFWVPGECSCVTPARAQRFHCGGLESSEDLCSQGAKALLCCYSVPVTSENLFLDVKLDLQNIPSSVDMSV